MVLALAARADVTRPPVLRAEAFQSPRPCALEPFAALEAGQIERRLEDRCPTGPRQPRLTPQLDFDREGGRAQARFGPQLAWHVLGLSARLQLDLAAQLASHALSARTQVAAGLWWQTQERMVVGLRLGGRRDDAGARSHQWSITGAWRPAAGSVLYTRWSIDDADAQVREIGWRWWLVARRVSLDLLLPAAPEREDRPARLRFAWRGLTL